MRHFLSDGIVEYLVFVAVILALVLGTHNVCTVNGNVFSKVASQQR